MASVGVRSELRELLGLSKEKLPPYLFKTESESLAIKNRAELRSATSASVDDKVVAGLAETREAAAKPREEVLGRSRAELRREVDSTSGFGKEAEVFLPGDSSRATRPETVPRKEPVRVPTTVPKPAPKPAPTPPAPTPQP